MSEKKHSPEPHFLDENFNPKNEDSENTETQQDEESIHSMDIENANLPSTLDDLCYNDPTFDIALSQLSLQMKENPTSTPKSAGDQRAALERTSDQMAHLKKAAESMLVSGSAANPKGDSGSAANPKGDSGSAANPKGDSGSAANPKGDSGSAANPKGDSGSAVDQIAASESVNLGVASESLVQGSASWDSASLELPEPPRIDFINGLVRNHFPALFTEGNRLRDIYGVTNIRDLILLGSQNRLMFILYQNRVRYGGTNVEKLVSEALIMEIKFFYSFGLIRNLVMEGGVPNYGTLFPAPGQEAKMMCAALIMGFTLLAFADYTQTGREKRLKQLVEKCRANGVPLPHEPQAQPEHPLTNWLQCVSASYHELKQYVQALKDAINYISTTNTESITRELNVMVHHDHHHHKCHHDHHPDHHHE